MMDQDQITERAARIEALGYPVETAARLAARIGDTPVLDAAGFVIVLGPDRQTTLARLPASILN